MLAGAASFLPDLADWTHRRTDTIGASPTRRCDEQKRGEEEPRGLEGERERENEERKPMRKKRGVKEEKEPFLIALCLI